MHVMDFLLGCMGSTSKVRKLDASEPVFFLNTLVYQVLINHASVYYSDTNLSPNEDSQPPPSII